MKNRSKPAPQETFANGLVEKQLKALQTKTAEESKFFQAFKKVVDLCVGRQDGDTQIRVADFSSFNKNGKTYMYQTVKSVKYTKWP
jgi:hypothetical protein